MGQRRAAARVDAKPATEAAKLGLLFSAIAGMYGLLWLGAAVVQARGWDMRPIGNLALLAGLRR